MAGKKESSTPWRQTSVLIRADIFDKAREQSIDINEECNRALADRLGIDYRQQKIPEGSVPDPVIIAPNTEPALPKRIHSAPGVVPATAIINADDPRAAGAVKSRNLQKEKPARAAPATEPSPVSGPEKPAVPRQTTTTAPEKPKNPAPSKKKKGDSAKKFFTSMVIREDTEDTLVSKDDMYYSFERWCRDHHVLTIPDRKSFAVTLKNQFAVKEKVVDGTPVWVGVRIKG
jgi:hypothetical protein